MGNLRSIVNEFDWNSEIPSADEVLDFLEVDPDEDPREEARDQAGVYNFITEQWVRWHMARQDLDSHLKDEQAKVKTVRAMASEQIEAGLSAALALAMDEAAETLTNYARDNNLRAPTAERIKATAAGSVAYRQALTDATEQRLLLIEEPGTLQDLRAARDQAEANELRLEGLMKAINQRSTMIRVGGDVYIARTRGRLE